MQTSAPVKVPALEGPHTLSCIQGTEGGGGRGGKSSGQTGAQFGPDPSSLLPLAPHQPSAKPLKEFS